ncbi:hypothetical protein [Lentzea aerocolonigenes]|uniref:hypothetical protein n=1 Tax=Lentzea aerocolonigenes TaxID=68170 RepID=UPI0005636998|nr:hypothetical protein [Lentzea aerocolonigenes]MCP2248737.1 hypothetical protein [Lentzea aerocolonigenes]
MTERTGLGFRFFADGYEISGGINAIDEIGGGAAPLDYTAINQNAMDRRLGIRNGRMGLKSFLDGDPDTAHDRLSAMSQSNQILTALAGSTLGDPAACLQAKQANYDATRPQDGSFLFTTQAQSSSTPLEWQELLTAGLRTDTAATNGTGVDFAAATNFGLQAFLQVTEFTGTDVTVKLQQSSDNGATDAWADVVGGSFAQITTDPQAQRIQTARNLAVERYLRVVTVTTGGFTSLSFVCTVAKNVVEVII